MLSQQDARAFDQHLKEGCEICNAEVSDFEEVIGALGYAAQPVSPSDYLRDLLAVRIEKEAATPRSATGSVISFPQRNPRVRQFLDRLPVGRSFLPWAVA